MSSPRKSLQDADALLLYQVGPVYCCSPALPVEAVIMPPRLTHTPGSSLSMPGVFKYTSGIVHVVDLRIRFGVEDEDKIEPGRIVVVEVAGGHAGIWVDEINDVIQFPDKGWGQVPSHIPHNVFTRTLLYDKKILLYADFGNLHDFKETGYLRRHIELVKKEGEKKQLSSDVVVADSSVTNQANKFRDLTEQSHSLAENNHHKQLDAVQVKQESKAIVRNTMNSAGFKQNIRPAKGEKPEQVKSESTKSRATAYQKTRQQVDAVSRLNYGQKSEGTNGSNIDATGSRERSAPQVSSNTFVNKNITQDTYDAMPGKHSGVDQGSEKMMAEDNNLGLWGFALVLVVMLLVLFFSFEKIFPGNKYDQGKVVLNAPGKISDDKKDAIEMMQSGIVEKSVVDNVIQQTDVSLEAGQADADSEYMADIAHDKDDIVIILQQPEEDADVLKEAPNDINELNMVSQETREVVDNDIRDKSKDEYKAVQNIVSGDVIDIVKPDNNGVKVDEPVQDISVSNSEVKKTVLAKQEKMQKPLAPKKVVHIVVKGDTLWHISKRYIKDPFKYPELARLSKIKNPDLIYPGNKVIIIIENKKIN